MIDQEKFGFLVSRAIPWAKTQEDLILQYGVPLSPEQSADAMRCGVQDSSRIRVLVVDRIPMPDDEELVEAARRAQIITETSRGVTIGHGIIIRGDSWQNRELLLHQFVHVAQCERCGGLDSYLEQYLSDRRTCSNFSFGSFEDEARRLAREICAADEATKQPA